MGPLDWMCPWSFGHLYRLPDIGQLCENWFYHLVLIILEPQAHNKGPLMHKFGGWSCPSLIIPIFFFPWPLLHFFSAAVLTLLHFVRIKFWLRYTIMNLLTGFEFLSYRWRCCVSHRNDSIQKAWKTQGLIDKDWQTNGIIELNEKRRKDEDNFLFDDSQ